MLDLPPGALFLIHFGIHFDLDDINGSSLIQSDLVGISSTQPLLHQVAKPFYILGLAELRAGFLAEGDFHTFKIITK